MLRYAVLISSAVALVSAVACGGGEKDGSNQGGSGSGGEGTNLLPGGSGDGDGDGDGDGGIDGCAPFEAEGCSGITYEGENVPLDIYVMFDLSCSMSCTVDQSGCCKDTNPAPVNEWRITPVREAMRHFLEDPASAGIGVGLGMFGDHNVGNPNDPMVCSVEAHADAEVPIGVLPGSAPDLIAALEAAEPQGGTPTHLAVDGACVYANAWREQNPSHKVVILLVTDGIPEHSCNANITSAVRAARECYDGGAGREIYVLGVEANNNNSLAQLNEIADAGGTRQAYLTDANDVAGSVLAALNAIRADASIPCTLNVPKPDGGTVDYGKVNVGICDAAEQTVPTFFVDDPAKCERGAWYYEGTGDNRVVQLCDQTCGVVGVSGASLTLSVGCNTVVR